MPNLYKFVNLNVVNSTNTWAKEALACGAIAPYSVVVANTQTAGRGQMKTIWQDAPASSLLFTAVLPVKVHVNHFFTISMAVSLAVKDALCKNFDVKLKWPNDLFLAGKKLGGILIETSLQGEWINLVFAGVGININGADFLSKLDAICLAEIAERPIDKAAVLQAVLDEFQHVAEAIAAPEKLHKAYENALLGTDEFLRYTDKNGEFYGRVRGVKKNGRLLLEEKESGQIRLYNFKEVSLIR